MAQTSWPFENIDTSETQFSQWARNIGEGVKQNTLDELEVYADSSGMQVKVKAGQALIRGHYYQSSAQEVLTIATAPVTNSRIDNVVLELDPSANHIQLVVVAGTPASTPVAPTLTQTDGGIYQIKLAQILVGPGVTTIAANKVTDTRTMLITTSDLVSDIATLESDVATLQTSKVPIAVAVSTKTGNYTLVAADTSDFIAVNGTVTITVPASVFTTGERVDVVSTGANTVTFAAGAGLTLSSKESKVLLNKAFSGASIFFTSATTAILIGDLN
jgi:hypothetical protein